MNISDEEFMGLVAVLGRLMAALKQAEQENAELREQVKEDG